MRSKASQLKERIGADKYESERKRIFQEGLDAGFIESDSKVDDYELQELIDYDNRKSINGMQDIENVIKIITPFIDEHPDLEIHNVDFDAYMCNRFHRLGVDCDYKNLRQLRSQLQSLVDEADDRIAMAAMILNEME